MTKYSVENNSSPLNKILASSNCTKGNKHYFISALATERLDFKLLGLAVCQVPGAIFKILVMSGDVNASSTQFHMLYRV